MTEMLKVVDLHARAGEREILKGVNLTVNEGETCVLFGPNGSGKSTLMSTIMGYSSIEVTSGQILFKGEDITDKTVDQRAKMGIGMMMQRPPNIYGVKLGDLIKASSPNGEDGRSTSASPEGRSRGPSSCSSRPRSPSSSSWTSPSPGWTWRTSTSSAGRSTTCCTTATAPEGKDMCPRWSSPTPARSWTTSAPTADTS